MVEHLMVKYVLYKLSIFVYNIEDTFDKQYSQLWCIWKFKNMNNRPSDNLQERFNTFL